MVQIAQIVCLANSYKRGGRCIAGIDLNTHRWVRPIGDGHEGAIGGERIIDRAEPQILDVLQIELDGNADDKGCQPENKALASTAWHKVGRMKIDDVLQYTENTSCLLHDCSDRVAFECFGNKIPESQWKSLQLIEVSNASFKKNPWDRIECFFRYSSRWYSLKAPCPEADEYLGQKGKFILTISMGGPYARETGDQECCYKMVAGAIKL